MELTQGQISEIISNYTSSSEGFVTLQSLIMNSLMAHERDLFVKVNNNEQCNGFRPRRWYCNIRLSCAFHVAIVVISIPYF
ncbi:hypothetical protein SAMN02745202_02367 [Segatella oulorum]|uniref:Uncharacterized protein n=1 Tax=Segatella oulorum TaxID=28136 RepID=A0A1T4RPG6_9BACT|nr:hypothetical protein SAMN02745202_02367 [Segatella oulorum]